MNLLSDSEIRHYALVQWVIKESAIKWQRGQLAPNISQWQWEEKLSIAINQKKGYQLNIYQLSFLDWEIAVASKLDLISQRPIICF